MDRSHLSELIRSGDADKIVRALHPVVRRMVGAAVRSRDADLLDTAAHNALLAVCRYHHTFAGRSRATTWLYTIARREALKCVRSASAVAQNLISLSDDDVSRTVESEFATTPALGESLDAMKRLEALVPNPEWRQVWLLWNDPGTNRSHEDVARLTGYTPGSVSATLSKVRRDLRASVQD